MADKLIPLNLFIILMLIKCYVNLNGMHMFLHNTIVIISIYIDFTQWKEKNIPLRLSILNSSDGSKIT